MKKTLLKWLLLTVLLVYVVVAAAWARDEALKNMCTGISVKIAQGNTPDSISSDGVLAEIERFPDRIVGLPTSRVNTKKLEDYLKKFSTFEDVECTFSSSGKLNVKVTPMIPALRVFEGDKSYYINKDGKVIESKASFFVDVPVATGTFSKTFTPRHILPVVNFVENDRELSKLIGMIQANGPSDILLIPRIQGHIVNFGDTTRLNEKKAALMAVYRKVMPYKGWEEYDTISVKFKGQVVATRRDKSRLYQNVAVEDETDMEEATLPEILNEE